MGQLKASGKDVVHEQEGNIVVINTCGFINNAKEESINTIDRWTSTINVRISNYQRTIDSALRYSGGYVRDYSSIRRSDTNLWDFGKYY